MFSYGPYLAEASFFMVTATVATLAAMAGALSALIVISDRYLNDYGVCELDVNGGERTLQVKGGCTVLDALASEKIFIPSACGGRGTCLYCKLKVETGGGDLGPAEKGGLSAAERRENVRLCCQVKVRGDMKLTIPDEYFKIKEYACKVISNRNVATFIKELVLEIPKGESFEFEAGHYVQVHVPPFKLDFGQIEVPEKFRVDWDHFKLWDLSVKNDEELQRAYSMANHPAEGNRVMLNVRIATPPPPHRLRKDDPEYPLQLSGDGTAIARPGLASSYIFGLKAGDDVTVSGPYGDFLIKETEREMVYVGGGAGMAPMRSHLFHLLDTQKSPRKITYWYGARSVKEIFYADELDRLVAENPSFRYVVALSERQPEDVWDGPEGYIHNVLDTEYLANHPDPTSIEYYLCGPPIMVDAVEDMLVNKYKVPLEMIAFDKFG